MRTILYRANFVLTILVLCMIADWAPDIGARVGHVDYRIYRLAGEGITRIPIKLPNGNIAPWNYSDYLAPIFTPLGYITPSQWFFLELLVLIVLILKVVETTEYAWIVLLASSVACCECLASGNIAPLLAISCLSPWGAALGCLFKPYLFGFVLLHIAARTVGLYRSRKTAKTHKH